MSEQTRDLTRDDLRQMIFTMVIAAAQADGKELADLTKEQMDKYCASAAEDTRLAARVLGLNITEA